MEFLRRIVVECLQGRRRNKDSSSSTQLLVDLFDPLKSPELAQESFMIYNLHWILLGLENEAEIEGHILEMDTEFLSKIMKGRDHLGYQVTRKSITSQGPQPPRTGHKLFI